MVGGKSGWEREVGWEVSRVRKGGGMAEVGGRERSGEEGWWDGIAGVRTNLTQTWNVCPSGQRHGPPHTPAPSLIVWRPFIPATRTSLRHVMYGKGDGGGDGGGGGGDGRSDSNGGRGGGGGGSSTVGGDCGVGIILELRNRGSDAADQSSCIGVLGTFCVDFGVGVGVGDGCGGGGGKLEDDEVEGSWIGRWISRSNSFTMPVRALFPVCSAPGAPVRERMSSTLKGNVTHIAAHDSLARLLAPEHRVSACCVDVSTKTSPSLVLAESSITI